VKASASVFRNNKLIENVAQPRTNCLNKKLNKKIINLFSSKNISKSLKQDQII